MLTMIAKRYQRIVYALVIALSAVGAIAYTSLPALEDPPITIREASILVEYPGQTPERIERLVTRPLEQAARQLDEISEIESSSLPGLSIVNIEVGETYDNLDQIWDDLRDQLEIVRGTLPEGTSPPIVLDDIGEVSVVTLALKGDGYTMGELGEYAEHVRDRLYSVAGVKSVVISGEVPERIEVTLDDARLFALGLSPAMVSEALSSRNIVRPGGQIDLGPKALLIEPTGEIGSVQEVGETLITTPGGTTVYLRDIATITRTLQDPPGERAYFNAERAIVISVAMLEGERVLDFGPRIREATHAIENTLPVGLQLSPITFQADQVANSVFGVTINVGQTILLVLAVVIFLLGLRTGLIVGTIVPTVMLATVAFFSAADLALERMSLATLVIALGLFVDNAIVVAEDFRRRLGAGESRDEALEAVGKELSAPLLISTATTILVFLPLMLAPSSAGEYTRSISIVIAISLSISWLMAMSLTPLLCYHFVRAADPENRPFNERMFDPLRRGYGRVLAWSLAHRGVFLTLIGLALAGGMAGMATASQKFFPDSDRAQLVTYVDLPAGTSAARTDIVMRNASKSIQDAKFDWLVSNATYVGYGGPRFVLSLTPVDPAPNRAVMVTNVTSLADMDRAVADMRTHFRNEVPDARATVTRMFLGPSDSNVVEIEVSGPDPDYLLRMADEVAAVLRDVPGAIDISHDWDGLVPRLTVQVDQAKAQNAGVTSASVAEALSRNVSGTMISEFREGDDVIPIVARGEDTLRQDPSSLETLPIFDADGRAVPLGQVADIEVTYGFSRIERQNLTRAVTIEGRSTLMAAEDIAAIVRPEIERLKGELAVGHDIAFTGVVKESAESGASMAVYMPLCFGLLALLLLIQFNSFRRALVVMLSMPLVIIGIALGLHVMQAPFGFMIILAIFSLFGIILNNGIVLIDRIDIERAQSSDAIESIIVASSMRLRPIIMTTITTVLGLLPLIIARDALFYGFASVVAFGLVVGTVLTLGVVPVLYSLLCARKSKKAGRDVRPATIVEIPFDKPYAVT